MGYILLYKRKGRKFYDTEDCVQSQGNREEMAGELGEEPGEPEG